MLPIGVVIPTKNSMKYLPGHLDNLSTWIDLAEQVVAVDSFSTDGTVDYLKKNLPHPQIRFVEHPPGLYASWNFGISQIASEFCYISTVGDSITREGIEHLANTASRLHCDVLVSHPDFVNKAGQPCEGPEWPMLDVMRRLGVQEPVRLPSTIMVATAFLHTGGAITGSCASDLFRTAILQKYPFPLDFGTAGDGGWSLQNAGRVIWAATPEKVTTFRRHPPTASATEIKVGETANQFAQLAKKIAADWLEANTDYVSTEVCAHIRSLLSLSIKHEELRRRYNAFRKGKWPWVLNPTAWRTRTQRNQLKLHINGLMQWICKQVHTDNLADITK
jgi:hypothetical protein